MLTRWQFWLLTLLSVISVSLIAANIWRFAENRRQQADVNQRAQFVRQAAALETLNREIVSALAQLAVRNKDDALRAMLASLGLTVTESNPAPAPPQPAAATPARK